MEGITKKKNGRWSVQIWRFGNNYSLGTYDTLPEAKAARRAGEKMADKLNKMYKITEVFRIG